MSEAVKEFRLGWIVNPYAGVGGPSAMKGSDAPDIQARAQAGELELTAPARAVTFWQRLCDHKPGETRLNIITLAGAMGSDWLSGDAEVTLVDYQPHWPSRREDTLAATKAIIEQRVDLLVFVGGDGTARDICSVIGTSQPALGVPAGVKMHSGVYAINPQLAAELVAQLLAGELVNLVAQEVRDIDEEAFRQGVVKARYFGEMMVPAEGRFVQHVKQGGLEVEELVLLDIADHLQESLPAGTLVVLGPGSTTFHIARNWGLETTLLGVDLLLNGRVLAKDVAADLLLEQVHAHAGPIKLILTAIGGQGHIIGRGNQQLSSEFLRTLGRENLIVVATKTKLKTLGGRPLLMDSGDARLDRDWQGFIPVLTGFDDRTLYPLGQPQN